MICMAFVLTPYTMSKARIYELEGVNSIDPILCIIIIIIMDLEFLIGERKYWSGEKPNPNPTATPKNFPYKLTSNSPNSQPNHTITRIYQQ